MPFAPFKYLASVCLGMIFIAAAKADDSLPVSTDPRLKIELYAESPQIVTPTGIDVDHLGRVWAIESNTHFPPEGYQGHPTDRILVMEGKDSTGKVEKITVFRDGLTHSMSVAVKPVWLDIVAAPEKPGLEKADSGVTGPDGKKKTSTEVFIATRREILLCTDTDGDLKCDDVKQLVHLETTGNYPHNGLAGFAFDALGYMYFGFGENLGADYKIIGSDGVTLSGGGEGGNIYRCRPDGSKLEQWATGFWNPHASCFDAFGHLFSLDNDPDSRPPCRLLHIIQGGDYGYRFRNGRKGTHPFTAWNGEIPGTLPMVSGTGEAPSGIVCYESDGLPEDYVGRLLAGSWGDHRIDKFVLKPRGASFESMPQPVIKGGENFRPVGLAVAPDGSIYATDWVSKEYKLHGKGRVWRISAVNPPKPEVKASSDTVSRRLRSETTMAELSTKLVERRRLARELAESSAGRAYLVRMLNNLEISERSRIEALWALANVPIAVAKLNLFRDDQKPAPFLTKLDTVSVAAAGLLGTPQLVPPNPAPEDLFGMETIIEGNPWSIYIVINATEYYLKTHNLAGVGYLVESNDPFLQTLVMQKLRKYGDKNGLVKSIKLDALPRGDLNSLSTFLVIRTLDAKNAVVVRHGLTSDDIRVRRAAVQWVGEEHLNELRPDVEKVLASEPMTGDLFLACLASLSMLDGVPPAEFEKAPPVKHILPIVTDSKRSASLRAIALRMLPPSQKELDAKLLGELVASSDETLRREAVRTLAQSPIAERNDLLRGIATNEMLDANIRADAVSGLAGVGHHAKFDEGTRDLLIKLASSDKSFAVRFEAIRSLRGGVNSKQAESARDAVVTNALTKLASTISQEPAETRQAMSEELDYANGTYRPRLVEQLLAEYSATADQSAVKNGTNYSVDAVESGRRTFFHVNGAGCFRCHMVGGRGGQVGPDLTVIARTMDRKKLAESILEPNKEISPQFTTWAIETTSGKVLTGMLLGEEVNGDLRLGNNQGEVFFVPFKDIETRSPLKTSIMPEKLHETMTASELRDLITYLETLK